MNRILKSDWQRAFLAITWELDFSYIYRVCRMIKGHKFFHSTSFPDKTNDLIFLKSKKKNNCCSFLPIFWSFLSSGFFQKKLDSVVHISIWSPNIIQSFRKNWCANSKKTAKKKDRQMNGWMGQSLIHKKISGHDYPIKKPLGLIEFLCILADKRIRISTDLVDSAGCLESWYITLSSQL